MSDEIAVYLGENGETASLYEKGKVVIYQKKRDNGVLPGKKTSACKQCLVSRI